MTEEQLTALLRQKRDATPPPGYFEQLLADVHRRQRADLLQQPLWKIALERFQTFFGEHSMSPLAYAGALASLVVAGGVAAGLSGVWPDRLSGAAVAQQEASSGASLALAAPEQPHFLDLRLANVSPAPEARTAQAASPQHSPRYVIDARPVSYEPSFSF